MSALFLEDKMKKEKIKCLLVEPYELPKEIEIENTLEAKKNLVGGYIECTYFKMILML